MENKWIILILAIGLVGYFVVPRLWIASPYLENTPLKEVIKPPQVEIWDIEIEGAGLKGIDLNLVLAVTNPNSIPMTLDSATFKVYIDGDYVGMGSFPSTTIGGHSTEYIRTYTKVSWGGGLKSAWNIFKGKITGSGSTLYVEGNAHIGSFSIPFSYSKPL